MKRARPIDDDASAAAGVNFRASPRAIDATAVSSESAWDSQSRRVLASMKELGARVRSAKAAAFAAYSERKEIGSEASDPVTAALQAAGAELARTDPDEWDPWVALSRRPTWLSLLGPSRDPRDVDPKTGIVLDEDSTAAIARAWANTTTGDIVDSSSPR